MVQIIAGMSEGCFSLCELCPCHLKTVVVHLVLMLGYNAFLEKLLCSLSLKFIGLDIQEFRFLKTLLSWLLFSAVAIFTISAMFKYIPAVKVEYRYALRSALMTGIVFTCFQYIYLETQLFVSRLNAVYGVLAAIPLFMIWLNVSWQIIMYGCMLCRAFHNADDYNLD